VPDGVYRNEMRVDGYDAPVDMVVTLTVAGDRLTADFAGHLRSVGLRRERARGLHPRLCVLRAEMHHRAGGAEQRGSWSRSRSPRPRAASSPRERPAPVSVRHVLGHLVPDVVLGALHQALPDTVPAEGASSLWNIQIAPAPARPRKSGWRPRRS
jgi:N-methylhydantoinase B